MNLTELQALGADVNAGFLDINFEGAHRRLGSVTAGGDIVFTADGQNFVDGALSKQYATILGAADINPGPIAPVEAPAPKAPKAPRAPKAPKADATPAAADTPTDDVPADDTGIGALDAALAG